MKTQKLHFNLLALGLFGVLLCAAPKLFATEQEERLLTQHFLEERVLKIIRGYDKEALVFVDLSSSTKSLELPSLPFSFDVNSLKTKGEATADLATVTIFSTLFSKDAKLPNEASELIRRIGKPYAKSLTMKVAAFPKGYDAATPSVPADLSETKKSEPTRWGEMWDALQASNLVGGLSATKTKFFRWGLFGVIALFGVMASLMFVLWRHLSKMTSVQGAIEAGLGKVATALENSDGPGSVRSSEGEYRTPSSAANKEATDGFSSLPHEGLLALLSDCYWAKEDDYGAFLWRQLPVAARKRLIDAATFMGTYAAHLAQFSGVSKGFESDPYYLAPLDVHHLSNEALSKLIKTHPNLYRALPELRSLGLDLPLKERLTLSEQRGSSSLSQPKDVQELKNKLKQLPPSPPRPLRLVKSLPIKSLADEQELLSWPKPSIDIMAATPSLVWSLHLADDVLSRIVTDMPARELANAMIGPEAVLAKIAALLPQKRRELVGNYLKKAQPQRENAAFLRLHQSIVDALKAQAGPGEVSLALVEEEDSHDLSA
ncbi:MAG: hypothetical protein NTV34_10835 [Proteobacteria bacterium]|nr:hypothetical protein [Pseudomonadota bacterium]